MRIKMRKTVLIGLVAVILLTAGCSQASDNSTPTATATANETPTPTPTPTPIEYHGDASDYLLDSTDVDSRWTVNATREPNFDLESESGRVIEFVDYDTEDAMIVAVVVFDSPESADTLLDQQRASYTSQGATVVNQSVGDRAFTTSSGDVTYLDTRVSNVYIQVYGTPHLATLTNVANDQIDEITG